jgi:hypothetical protein
LLYSAPSELIKTTLRFPPVAPGVIRIWLFQSLYVADIGSFTKMCIKVSFRGKGAKKGNEALIPPE